MAASNPRANEIFSAAVKIPIPAAHQAHLDNACGDDVELRRQVPPGLAANDGLKLSRSL
jgi:hypothetical protein